MTRDTWHLQFIGRTITVHQAIEAAYDAGQLGVRKEVAMQYLFPRIEQIRDDYVDDGPDWYQQHKLDDAARRRKIVENMPDEDCDGLRGG